MNPTPLIFISFFLFSCKNIKTGNDLIRQHLQGNIRSVTDSLYEIEEDSVGFQILRLFSCKIDKYDEKGCQILEELRSANGSLEDRRTYKHDSKGNQIEENDHDSISGLTLKNTSTYNEENNLIEMHYFDSLNKPSGSSIFKYDGSGHMIEEDQYDLDGSLNNKDIWTYDKNGNPMKMIQRGHTDNSIMTYKFDNNDNMTEYCLYRALTSKNELIFKIEYRYADMDKMGNWLKQMDYRENKLRYIMKRSIEYYP
jgi:hypothetical protein